MDFDLSHRGTCVFLLSESEPPTTHLHPDEEWGQFTAEDGTELTPNGSRGKSVRDKLAALNVDTS